MIAFLLILCALFLVFELASLNIPADQVSFEYHTDRKSTEPDTVFYMIEKASNASRLPLTYLKARIVCPAGQTMTGKKAAEINAFERKSTKRFFLMPRRSVTKKAALTLSERGVYWFEEAELEKGDFLGLSTAYSRVWGYAGIVVYPRRLEDSRSVETLSGITGDYLSKAWLMRDPILSVGVREYTGREPMKSISWKKSASRGELMVREYDYTRERSCIICVLGGLNAGESEMELCARIARTAAEQLTEQGVWLHFFTNAYCQALRPFEVRHADASRGAMDSLLDLLARIRPGECGPDEKLLDEIMRLGAACGACILIAPKRNEEADAFRAAFEKTSRNECVPVYAEDFAEVLL